MRNYATLRTLPPHLILKMAKIAPKLKVKINVFIRQTGNNHLEICARHAVQNLCKNIVILLFDAHNEAIFTTIPKRHKQIPRYFLIQEEELRFRQFSSFSFSCYL